MYFSGIWYHQQAQLISDLNSGLTSRMLEKKKVWSLLMCAKQLSKIL